MWIDRGRYTGRRSSMGRNKDTPEQAEFRQYCERWLGENSPGRPPSRLPEMPIEVIDDAQKDYLVAWQNRCWEAGLVGADYPTSYGGGGHDGFQRIANQEMGRAGTPFMLNVVGLNMAAPTILRHGTEEQKLRYIQPILSGEEIWCQGFSEPNAGSDLASLQASAVRNGDDWTINGHKVWTSLAHFAKWMIMMCRTSKEEKHGGITYFLVPVADTPGVTVRPLIKITGQAGFNEVLFEDVVVGDAQRLDEVGKGWEVAMTTLLHERGAAESAGGGGSHMLDDRVTALIDLAKRTPRRGATAWDDAVIRDQLMQLLVRAEGMKQNARRARVESLCDAPLRLPLQTKVLVSELMQDLSAMGVTIAGPSGSLYLADDNAPDKGEWPLTYLNSFGFTIAAGTSEVQRNILGERVLGLAKSK
jgi:alkylation response protein AidB-like acyl-CoA dehydrogenase